MMNAALVLQIVTFGLIAAQFAFGLGLWIGWLLR